MDNKSELPEIAAVVTPMGEQALVKRGESGYWPLEGMTADEYNEAHGIAANVSSAYLFGSMFGWHVPGADPENEMNMSKLPSDPAKP